MWVLIFKCDVDFHVLFSFARLFTIFFVVTLSFGQRNKNDKKELHTHTHTIRVNFDKKWFVKGHDRSTKCYVQFMTETLLVKVH